MPSKDPKNGKSSTSGPLTYGGIPHTPAHVNSNAILVSSAATAWSTVPNGGSSGSGSVIRSPFAPQHACEGDVWIDDAAMLAHIFENGVWQPIHGVSLPETRCSLSGTHRMNADGTLRYSDGLIVGYCRDCETRIEVPFQSGGMDAVRLRDLAADLLVDSSDPTTVLAFQTVLLELRTHTEELQKALKEAEVVQQVMFNRWWPAGSEDASQVTEDIP